MAVVGDSNLDAAAMKPHRVAGDEARKQQLAEEVSAGGGVWCLVQAGPEQLCAT